MPDGNRATAPVASGIHPVYDPDAAARRSGERRLDPAEQVISTFRVIGVPNTFLIDREGVVQWKHIGPVLDDDPELLASLRAALGG